jgi:hypothetical protein
MINLLIDAGAKFNTTENVDERSMIPNTLIRAYYSDIALRDSLILTQNERKTLYQMYEMEPAREAKLIYRATIDGSAASSFHSKCDGISNTVTIIKTTSNSVFGGFTSVAWASWEQWTYDANAFIFSLRRFGNPNKQRFNVTRTENAIYRYYSYGPTFGGGHDIYVADNSNTNYYSYCNFGYSYQSPKNITYESAEAQSYLAGSYTWQTSEIEVYQVIPFESYSVTPLHNGCLIIIFYYFILILIYLKAVYNNNTVLVNLLIRIGVNLNTQDKFGSTPLHYGSCFEKLKF